MFARLLLGTMLACLASLVPGAQAAGTGRLAGNVTINPLAPTLVLASASVRVGEQFRAAGTVTDLAPFALTNVTLSLRADSSIHVLRSTQATFATVGAGATVVTVWSACAAAPGNYFLVAHVSAAASWSADSAAQLLSVTSSHARCAP